MVHREYFLPTIEIKYCDVMIDGKKFFDQWIRINLRTYDSIQKIVTGQEDDYTTGCLLNYNYFNNCCKMMAIDLSKQQTLDVDPKAIQQISFFGNLEDTATIFFIIEGAKETFTDFSQGTVRVL